MAARDISKLLFTTVYPLYLQKVLRKNRTKEEVDAVIIWLTGYSPEQLANLIKCDTDFKTFFDNAPAINPNVAKIKGLICGIRVEEIAEPTTQKIRYLDKLIDELAKGKSLEKILRK